MPTFDHNMSTGKGGEFAVASELLFRDFNANILTVDSGVDIAAIKDGRTYLFQVKTCHWNKNGQIYVNLELQKIKEFIQKNNLFFIVVGRKRDESNSNEYLIFPIEKIREFSEKQTAKPNKRGRDAVKLLFTKRKQDGNITLNACGDITEFRGAWNLIF